MLGIFKSLIAFFALFVVFVAAAPSPVTNAARFKQGLGPLKPKNLFKPTRRQGGSNPLSSSAPPIKAVIRAYDMSDSSNPSFLGYVAPIGDGLFGVTQDPAGATVIQTQLASLQPGNLDLVSPPYGGYPELGFSGLDPNLSPGSASIAYLSGTTSIPKYSPAVSTPDQSFTNGSQNEPTESAIWYLVDVATLEISPQWINSNGAAATTYLVYFTKLLYFLLSGDPATVRNVFGEYGANIPIRFNLDTVNVSV
ncbi:hypothetical protein FRC04_009654 [Tulasnella sp. 424]|nr:hypothetical protein FRC04_009654 [Tulasnella sp. 424]KAG8975952.1 hypothetical protein FRC05_004883 [Tulasnella sp. 425]